MLMLSIQAVSDTLEAVPMSEAGVSLLRFAEDWLAVFAVVFARGADCPRAVGKVSLKADRGDAGMK
jgi:hypothetical protein